MDTKQPMNPMIIGVVVVGILLAGGFALFSNKDNRSLSQATPTQIPSVTQTTKPTSSSETSDQGKVKEFTMTAKKFDFTPSTITVSEGDKVKLTITAEDVPHGFSIDELGIKQDIEVGKPTTVEFVASKKGIFRFYCSLFCGSGHREMEGQLIVE